MRDIEITKMPRKVDNRIKFSFTRQDFPLQKIPLNDLMQSYGTVTSTWRDGINKVFRSSFGLDILVRLRHFKKKNCFNALTHRLDVYCP